MRTLLGGVRIELGGIWKLFKQKKGSWILGYRTWPWPPNLDPSMEQQASTAADGSFASSSAQQPCMLVKRGSISATMSGSRQTSGTGACRSFVDPAAHTNQDQLHSDVSGAAKEKAHSNETNANSQHPTPTEEGASQPRDKQQVGDSSQPFWGRKGIDPDGRMYPDQQVSSRGANGSKRARSLKSKEDPRSKTPKKQKNAQEQQAVATPPTILRHGQGSNNQDDGSSSVQESPFKEGEDGDHEEESEDDDGSGFQLEEDHPFRKMLENIQTSLTKKLLGLEKMFIKQGGDRGGKAEGGKTKWRWQCGRW